MGFFTHSVAKLAPVSTYLNPRFAAKLYRPPKKAWSCGVSRWGTWALKNASCRSCISSQSMTSVCRSRHSPSTIFSMLLADCCEFQPASTWYSSGRRSNLAFATYARYELSTPPLIPMRQSWSRPLPSRRIASICLPMIRSPTASGCQCGRMFRSKLLQ